MNLRDKLTEAKKMPKLAWIHLPVQNFHLP